MPKTVEIDDDVAQALAEYAQRKGLEEWVVVQGALQHYLERFGGYTFRLEGGRWIVERSDKK